MSTRPTTTWLVVVFGALGSLGQDKLWRALFLNWYHALGMQGLYCLGVDQVSLKKRGLSEQLWVAKILEKNKASLGEIYNFSYATSRFSQSVEYVRACSTDPKSFQAVVRRATRLKKRILRENPGTMVRTLYYLALPPQQFSDTEQNITSMLVPPMAQLDPPDEPVGQTLVVEKPLGQSLAEARPFVERLRENWSLPDNFLCMDHFAFKTEVRDLLARLYGNSDFSGSYRFPHVAKVLISAYEPGGVGGRNFFGTLCDSIQSHLGLLYALTWEDPYGAFGRLSPGSFGGDMGHFGFSATMKNAIHAMLAHNDPTELLGWREPEDTLPGVFGNGSYCPYVLNGRAVELSKGKLVLAARGDEPLETASRILFYPQGRRWLQRTLFELRYVKLGPKKELGVTIFFRDPSESWRNECATKEEFWQPRGKHATAWRFVIERQHTLLGGQTVNLRGFESQRVCLGGNRRTEILSMESHLEEIPSLEGDGYVEALRSIFQADRENEDFFLHADFQLRMLEVVESLRDYSRARFAEDPQSWRTYLAGTDPFPEAQDSLRPPWGELEKSNVPIPVFPPRGGVSALYRNGKFLLSDRETS